MSRHKKSSHKHTASVEPGTFTDAMAGRNVRPPLLVMAGAALIAMLVIAVYLPSINGGFLLDDDGLVTENRLILASDGLYRIWFTTEAADYWPMTNTVFWVEWRLWGMNSTGYHVTSLILHIAESLLLWIILRRLSLPGALLAAVIFALHPVNVESVAWISQQKNMLTMLFLLLSILWYLKENDAVSYLKNLPEQAPGLNNHPLLPLPSPLSPTSSPLYWYRLSLLAFLMAMLSKGSAAVLPGLLFIIVAWLRPPEKRDLMRLLPFFLVAVVLAGVNIWFQTHNSGEVIRTAGFMERLLGAGGVIWFYLYKALFPLDLAFVYPQWHIQTANLLWWLPLSAAVIVTAILWRWGKNRGRPFLFAWGFFCVALVPVLGFTDVGFMQYSLVADHYQHIAIIGIITLISASLITWQRQLPNDMRRAAAVVVIVLVGALALLTWRHNKLYGDAIKLYLATLDKNPECSMVHSNLGIVLAKTDRMREAMEHWEQALKFKSHYPKAHYNLGLAYVKTGRLPEAIKHYEETLRQDPDYIEAYNNLGAVLVKAGRLQEAIECFQQALRRRPENAEAYSNMGDALLKSNRPQEAIECFLRAIKLNPDCFEAHYNLALALKQEERFQDAIEHYEQALRIKPDYAEAHVDLGTLLILTGRPETAIEHLRQAIRLDPRSFDALNYLGMALSTTGKPQEGIDYFNKALRLNPDLALVHYNLALAYAQIGQPSAAVAAARKAMELAQSQGQTALAKQIEDWLNNYMN